MAKTEPKDTPTTLGRTEETPKVSQDEQPEHQARVAEEPEKSDDGLDEDGNVPDASEDDEAEETPDVVGRADETTQEGPNGVSSIEEAAATVRAGVAATRAGKPRPSHLDLAMYEVSHTTTDQLGSIDTNDQKRNPDTLGQHGEPVMDTWAEDGKSD